MNLTEKTRAKTRKIKLGNYYIGGGAPVLVQSMTNTDTRDTEKTLSQIQSLYLLGCEAVRIAVPDKKAANQICKIVNQSPVPIICDIHFDWRLAIAALEAGASGLRINPGNIGSKANVHRIIDCAKQYGSIIRIGINSGSLQKDILAKYGSPTPQAMVESALQYISLFEKRGFYDIKLSLKSSSVMGCVQACRLVRSVCEYPLHIGITEAGPTFKGAIKSAVGLGILLSEGIGDTIRVSLTGPPEEEVKAAYEILAALGLRRRGPELISCPTCGRTEINLIHLAGMVEKALADCNLPLKVAVMGCVVNGPGEAREADIGLAGGRDKGIIFKKGEIIKTVRGEAELLSAFLDELHKMIKESERASIS